MLGWLWPAGESWCFSDRSAFVKVFLFIFTPCLKWSWWGSSCLFWPLLECPFVLALAFFCRVQSVCMPLIQLGLSCDTQAWSLDPASEFPAILAMFPGPSPFFPYIVTLLYFASCSLRPAVMKHLDQLKVGFVLLTFPHHSDCQKKSGQEPRVWSWSRGHGGVRLTGLLLMVCFPVQPGPSTQEQCHLQWAGPSHINH